MASRMFVLVFIYVSYMSFINKLAINEIYVLFIKIYCSYMAVRSSTNFNNIDNSNMIRAFVCINKEQKYRY